MKTRLSEDLGNAADKAQYNAHCKRLLANRQVIVRILKETVEEFKDCTLEEIEACLDGEPEVSSVPVLPGTGGQKDRSEYVRGEQDVDEVPGEGQITYDVRFRMKVPGQRERIMLYLNLEGQQKFNPGYPLIKRGIFYGARMVSAQYGIEFNGTNYSGIQKVYSIWVCMNTPRYMENSIVAYTIKPQVLAGNPKRLELKENYDIINVIQICLGKGNIETSLLQMLRVLFSETIKVEKKKAILSEQYGMKMEYGTGKEIEIMCNFADIVEEKAMERGMKKGLEQGLEVLIQTCQELGLDRTDTLFRVQAKLNLSEEEAESYLKKYWNE